ncbi:hypothetical protein Moror_17444 [Moniliophthora roreri MCA 2997]|uniref:Uncharacterized protein n=1 Tax=Moniliophthora roreri (strain MCA 2997) TaxID=1381753 RepID=V2XVF7_MONRO|nr:hypothetical protein Moror_17444 [Moniliophthora roreri MCA 2997]
MSSSLPNTVDQDADDDELCMVCDGKCTCASSSHHQTPSTSLPHPTTLLPQLPKLKIKLPPKPKIFSGIPPDLPDQTPIHTPTQQPQPKRRGRPPKNGISAQPRSSNQRARQPSRRPPPQNKSKVGIKKKPTAVKRKRPESTDNESSDLTDIDQFYNQDRGHSYDNGPDDAPRSSQFPTFISSISSTTSSSDSDSSSLSGFETDSSIEAEEENFIIAEERARIRRELLGEETLQKRRDNNWVIRPRKRSVGTPSDVDMDADSDEDNDQDEDDAQDDEQDDDDDEDDDQDESDTRLGAGYVGFATGWSDDDKSSFDADLFFANLSSDSDSDGSSTQGEDDGVDGDQSDLDALTEAAASIIPHLRQTITHMPFDVTEGWDGQIVFTNGLGEAQGTASLDVQFPPSPFVPETSASPSADGDGDVDMLSTDADPDEEGYEQDVDTVGEGDGDTTDEELVGEDDLPNERAMQLFNTPFTSVSYINPMSTMSPTASPAYGYGKRGFHAFDSPKPADILAGKVYWDSDDHDEFANTSSRKAPSRSDGPRQGEFEVTSQSRQAIIDDQHKNIPSPHPRFKGRHTRLSVSQSGAFEDLLRRSLQPLRPSSLPPSTRFSLQPSSASEVGLTSPDLPPDQAIDLDDVLDASFLGGDETQDEEESKVEGDESSSTDSATESDTRKHLKNLKRWDVISVGAFRKTREAVGCPSDGAAAWGSDPPADYSTAMKSSPLNAMLWQNRNAQRHASTSRSAHGYELSPELSPVRDGDRTPTSSSRSQNKSSINNGGQYHQNNTNKTRKELRRERRLKQKSYGPLQHHQYHRHHHHHHQHHPNSKSRSTSATQRNFFSSPSSVPTLNI